MSPTLWWFKGKWVFTPATVQPGDELKLEIVGDVAVGYVNGCPVGRWLLVGNEAIDFEGPSI